jgi:voltage-gated potassium channel
LVAVRETRARIENNGDLSHYPEWKKRVHTIIFGTETFWGRTFDLILLVAILLSVIAVMLESVEEIDQKYGRFLQIFEWILTILFTIEYLLRIIVGRKPTKYMLSFFGIVDLLSILPNYISLILPGAQSLLAIRSIRLLRIFRILKLVRFVGEAQILGKALLAARHKITVFMGSVVTLVIILGTFMYLVEGGENGFTSIPKSIYWAIITLTTVGYGDIVPVTAYGQFIASAIMILGYSIIAIPTGIITAEIVSDKQRNYESRVCPVCGDSKHMSGATYCKSCGSEIDL